MPTHFYVFVCSDLSNEQKIVQAAHAAHESGRYFPPAIDNPSIVICQVPNELALYRVQAKAESRDIQTRIFKEPDLGNRATALCTETLTQASRKLFSNYPLIKIGGTHDQI